MWNLNFLKNIDNSSLSNNKVVLCMAIIGVAATIKYVHHSSLSFFKK